MVTIQIKKLCFECIFKAMVGFVDCFIDFSIPQMSHASSEQSQLILALTLPGLFQPAI